MNRTQRKKIVLAGGLALGGLAIAIAGPMLVMLLFLTSNSFDMHDPARFGDSAAAIERVGLIALGLQVVGFLITIASILYALAIIAIWFIGENDEISTLPHEARKLRRRRSSRRLSDDPSATA